MFFVSLISSRGICKEPGMFPALRSVCGVSKDVHPASFSIFPIAAIKGYVQMILLQNRPLALSFRCPCDISITDSLRMYTDEPLRLKVYRKYQQREYERIEHPAQFPSDYFFSALAELVLDDWKFVVSVI